MNITRCPRCGTKPPLIHLRSYWRSYVCRGCGALLRERVLGRAVCQALYLLPCAVLWALYERIFTAGAASIIGLVLIAIGMVIGVLSTRPRVIAEGPFCLACLYNRSGLAPDAPCPECGEVPAV